MGRVSAVLCGWLKLCFVVGSSKEMERPDKRRKGGSHEDLLHLGGVSINGLAVIIGKLREKVDKGEPIGASRQKLQRIAQEVSQAAMQELACPLQDGGEVRLQRLHLQRLVPPQPSKVICSM